MLDGHGFGGLIINRLGAETKRLIHRHIGSSMNGELKPKTEVF